MYIKQKYLLFIVFVNTRLHFKSSQKCRHPLRIFPYSSRLCCKVTPDPRTADFPKNKRKRKEKKTKRIWLNKLLPQRIVGIVVLWGQKKKDSFSSFFFLQQTAVECIEPAYPNRFWGFTGFSHNASLLPLRRQQLCSCKLHFDIFIFSRYTSICFFIYTLWNRA